VPEALRAIDVAVQRGRSNVLQGVSLQAAPGEIVALLGPNGAGKTTLLRALAGLAPYSGRIEIEGDELRTLPPRTRARRVTLLPQRSLLDAPLPVASVVAHGRYAHAPGLRRMSDSDRAAIDAALEATALTAIADRPFTALSYGEQRRVLLARALATGASVLLLDEPAAALDVAHALELFAMLERLAAQGHAIVAAVHQLDDARRYAHRGLLLAQGHAVAEGPIDEVVSAERVAEVYGVQMREQDALGFRRLTSESSS
jgi:iron complex transport system ATP-binding protein